jgi:hypothetical protein
MLVLEREYYKYQWLETRKQFDEKKRHKWVFEWNCRSYRHLESIDLYIKDYVSAVKYTGKCCTAISSHLSPHTEDKDHNTCLKICMF